jgi:hypothetical protein
MGHKRALWEWCLIVRTNRLASTAPQGENEMGQSRVPVLFYGQKKDYAEAVSQPGDAAWSAHNKDKNEKKIYKKRTNRFHLFGIKWW